MCCGDMTKGAKEPWNERQKKKKDKCNEFCVNVLVGSMNLGRQFSGVYISVFKKHTKIHHMPCDS